MSNGNGNAGAFTSAAAKEKVKTGVGDHTAAGWTKPVWPMGGIGNRPPFPLDKLTPELVSTCGHIAEVNKWTSASTITLAMLASVSSLAGDMVRVQIPGQQAFANLDENGKPVDTIRTAPPTLLCAQAAATAMSKSALGTAVWYGHERADKWIIERHKEYKKEYESAEAGSGKGKSGLPEPAAQAPRGSLRNTTIEALVKRVRVNRNVTWRSSDAGATLNNWSMLPAQSIQTISTIADFWSDGWLVQDRIETQDQFSDDGALTIFWQAQDEIIAKFFGMKEVDTIGVWGRFLLSLDNTQNPPADWKSVGYNPERGSESVTRWHLAVENWRKHTMEGLWKEGAKHHPYRTMRVTLPQDWRAKLEADWDYGSSLADQAASRDIDDETGTDGLRRTQMKRAPELKARMAACLAVLRYATTWTPENQNRPAAPVITQTDIDCAEAVTDYYMAEVLRQMRSASDHQDTVDAQAAAERIADIARNPEPHLWVGKEGEKKKSDILKRVDNGLLRINLNGYLQRKGTSRRIRNKEEPARQRVMEILARNEWAAFVDPENPKFSAMLINPLAAEVD